MSSLLELPRKRVLGIIAACFAGLVILILIARGPNQSASTHTGEIPLSFSDKIAASVNGAPIYQTQIDFAREHSGVFDEAATDADILDYLVEQKTLAQKAAEYQLDQRADIQNRLQLAQDQLLAAAMVEQYIADNVTENALRQFYDTQVKLQGSERQIKARQIVLPDDATAKEVIRRLDGGDSFASIALAFSIDRATRENSGDLGYITRGSLDPVLTDKIFSANDGQRLDPIKTSQGWHIIEVMSRRKSPVESFEARREQIRKLVTAQKLDDLLGDLRQNAKIDYISTSADTPSPNE